MSRSYCSYDEDWQRRKSVLIRSLFHDIPMLSPVAEESNDSFQYAPTQEVFASPPRPLSPLPPLIIERVPETNKHDEPEEYYRKLHKKIKKIYLKLFVENRNLNSIDYESDYNDSSVIDDNVNDSRSVENVDFNFQENISPKRASFVSMIEDREASESSNSTKSKGYETDYESVDTEMIDIENNTASNKEGTMRSGKEESSTDNNQSRRTSKEEESNNFSIIDLERTVSEDTNEMEEEKRNAEESLFTNLGKRKITEETSESEASKRLRKEQESNSSGNEHELTESEESNKPEDKQSYVEEKSSNENNNEHGIVKKTVAVDDPEIDQQEESDQSTTEDHESSESEVPKATENEKQSNETDTDLDLNKKVVKSKDSEKTASENASNAETMEKDEETRSHSSEDADFRQITTEALVHIDGSQNAEEKESSVYEDSVRSIILPTRFRRMMISHNVDDEGIETLPVLEENAGPKLVPTFDTGKSVTTDEDNDGMETPQPDAAEEDIDELEADKQGSEESRTHQSDTAEEEILGIGTAQANDCDKSNEEKRNSQQNSTDEAIEEMRSHPPNLSHETIPITHRSESESTSDHTAFPQEPTVMTSSSQDGVDRGNSEFKISNDMNEILYSILNESRIDDKTSKSERKRKLYVDKSVQAVPVSKISWDEMRRNFFVGTPKIFRLCACNDHVCH